MGTVGSQFGRGDRHCPTLDIYENLLCAGDVRLASIQLTCEACIRNSKNDLGIFHYILVHNFSEKILTFSPSFRLRHVE